MAFQSAIRNPRPAIESAVATVGVLLAVLGVGQAYAADFDLTQFLHGMEEATHVTEPLRADGQIEMVAPDATWTDRIAMIVRPPSDVFLEMQRRGIKALLLAGVGEAHIVGAGATRAEAFAASAPLAGSDFTQEDLEPFRLSHYRDWRISDETGAELTVTLFPQNSQYSLMVVTIDRQRKIPLKTLYYRETFNNLVKMRRDGDYLSLGGGWVPGTVTMETFKGRTVTTLRLHWRQDATFPRELFDPASIPRAGLVWPVAPAGAPRQKR